MKYYCFKFRKFNLQLLIYKCRKYVHIFFPVDDSLIDIFVSQSEEFRNRNDQFLHDAPYPFRNEQFQRILGYVLKELAHGLVGCKPLH